MPRAAARRCGRSCGLVRLGAIERVVGRLEPGIDRVLATQLRDADADGHLDDGRPAGALDALAQQRRDAHRVGDVVVGQQQRELLAAHAEQAVDAARAVAHERDHALQHLVAGGVAVAIVDGA